MTKKLVLRDGESEFDEESIAVEERPPTSSVEYACAEAMAHQTFVILRVREGGFELEAPDTLMYYARRLKGSGRFKLLVHGMTVWVDDSVPDAVVTYLHNASAGELTVECNDHFAIVTNFQSGDLGIHVPREASPRRRPALIDRGEAAQTFGRLRRRGRRRVRS